ncbi:hypothetical protein SUGI_0500700 [Cryptomeria japonica]|nr:hypothetical protein SUGI_0500700 [Cryptomeria japonica]
MQWYLSIHDYFNPPLYQLDVLQVKDNSGVSNNDLYESVQQYLEILHDIAPRQIVFLAKNSCNVCFSPANDEEVEDFFQGVTLPDWAFVEASLPSSRPAWNGEIKLRACIIQDIDCFLCLTDRVSRLSNDNEEEKSSNKVILSGFLNFTDGLWFCCREERIIVFTTNHKDMLDPAILRCGRMDMHILLSFCTFPAFKSLAFNYLEIKDHPLFSVMEEKMACGAEMTPAGFIEVLMNKMDDPDEASRDLIFALDGKKTVRNALLTS